MALLIMAVCTVQFWKFTKQEIFSVFFEIFNIKVFEILKFDVKVIRAAFQLTQK